jgi:hypothetical protein
MSTLTGSLPRVKYVLPPPGLASKAAGQPYGTTVKVVVAVIPVARSVAVIVVVPVETKVAMPCDVKTLPITATAVLDEPQETSVVRSGGHIADQVVGVAAE